MPYEYKYPPPENWPTFQRLCQRILQRLWKSDSVEIYGSPGQEQRGVDILEVSGRARPRAAQCKLHEERFSLSPKEVQDEVDRAKSFPEPLEYLLVMTTAKPSTKTQHAVIEINKKHKKEGFFEVRVMPWSEIRSILNENPDLAEDCLPGISAPSARLMRQEIAADLKQIIQDAISHTTGPPPTQYDADIESAVLYINKYEYQVARILLERLCEQHWPELTDRQKFRVLTNIATAFLGQGENTKAASGYLEAKRYQPDDQKACENEAFAYELLGEGQKAWALACKVREYWPQSARALALFLAESPLSATPEQLEKEIPPSLADEPEVCMTMCRRAATSNDVARAEKFARKAAEKMPNRAQPLLLLGQAILSSEMADSSAWV